MICLGLKPEAAGWKAQTNPLSYGGTQTFVLLKWPSLRPYYTAGNTLNV